MQINLCLFVHPLFSFGCEAWDADMVTALSQDKDGRQHYTVVA